MSRLTLRSLALSSLAVVTILLSACGSNSSTPPGPTPGAPAARVTLTADEARHVVSTYAATNSAAVQSVSAEAEGNAEEGVLYQVDSAALAAERVLGQTTDQPVTVTDVSVFVPRQLDPGNQAVFLARAKFQSGTQAPTNMLVLFVRDTPASTWKAAFAAAIENNTTPPTPVLDPQGFARLISASDAGQLKVAPADALTTFASYLQTGDPANPAMAPGVFTDANLRGQAAFKKQVTLQFQEQYSAPTPAAAVFALADGSGLVLGSLHEAETVHQPSGPITQDGQRRGFGGFLAPGDYKSVVSTSILQTAVVIPPKGSAAAPSVVALSSGVIGSEGVPCSAATC